MARYRMNDDTVVDTDKARQHWPGKEEPTEIFSEELRLSSKGRFYVVHTSLYDLVLGKNVQSSYARAAYLTSEAAAAWLLANGYDTKDALWPTELQDVAELIIE